MKQEDQLIFYKRKIFWLVIAFIFLALLFLGYEILSQDTPELRVKIGFDLLYELIATLLAILIFGFIYQIYVEKENREIAKRDLVETIHLNKEVLNLFTDQTKLHFIETIVKAIIGEKYGTQLFNSVIKTYLNGDVLYREDFEYDVEIFESKDDFHFTEELILSKAEYYSLNQTIIYSKQFKKESENIGFKVVFAFDEKSLDHYLNDNSVFFREIISINQFKQDIDSFTDEDFSHFVKNTLRLKLDFFGAEDAALYSDVDYDVRYFTNGTVRGLEVRLRDQQKMDTIIINTDDLIYYRCQLSFQVPFNKNLRRFHFILPEPTSKPKFTIRFDRSISNIDYVSYLTNTAEEVKINKDDYLSKYSIYTSEMMYPRSGLIFFWD